MFRFRRWRAGPCNATPGFPRGKIPLVGERCMRGLCADYVRTMCGLCADYARTMERVCKKEPEGKDRGMK